MGRKVGDSSLDGHILVTYTTMDRLSNPGKGIGSDMLLIAKKNAGDPAWRRDRPEEIAGAALAVINGMLALKAESRERRLKELEAEKALPPSVTVWKGRLYNAEKVIDSVG